VVWEVDEDRGAVGARAPATRIAACYGEAKVGWISFQIGFDMLMAGAVELMVVVIRLDKLEA